MRSQGSLVFGRRNVLLLVAGIAVVTIGYLFLGRGSITAAPILLVLGYCVIIPLSIILWVKKPDQTKRPETRRHRVRANSSAVRAPALQAGGRRFDSSFAHQASYSNGGLHG